MPRSKSTKANIRKLTRLGGHSLGLTLPIEITRSLGWRERQKVTVKKIGKRLIVEDWKKIKKF